jgi:hypothetical protein
MEIFFVYGLVLIFFIALPFVIFILIKEPARDPDAEKAQQLSLADSSGISSISQSAKSAQMASKIASYGLLAAIFTLLFIVSIATQRSHA